MFGKNRDRVDEKGEMPWKSAEEIFKGGNFFGPKQWAEIFGMDVPIPPKFPWDKKILKDKCPFNEGKKIKDTHFAFLGPGFDAGLNMVGWKKFYLEKTKDNPRRIAFLNGLDEWHRKEEFVWTTCIPKWYLVLIENAPESKGQSYQEQKNILQRDYPKYQMPLAVEAVTKNILFFELLLWKQKLNIWEWDRKTTYCRDVYSDGRHVIVNCHCHVNIEKIGIDLGEFWQESNIGLTPSRMF